MRGKQTYRVDMRIGLGGCIGGLLAAGVGVLFAVATRRWTTRVGSWSVCALGFAGVLLLDLLL
jgi:hypothetical protein